jgi:hypothetical protein
LASGVEEAKRRGATRYALTLVLVHLLSQPQAATSSLSDVTWRATGITIYLENDGRLEHAQQMAGHESPRTTKPYDLTK